MLATISMVLKLFEAGLYSTLKSNLWQHKVVVKLFAGWVRKMLLLL